MITVIVRVVPVQLFPRMDPNHGQGKPGDDGSIFSISLEENLGSRIDTVAVDLKAYRADTVPIPKPTTASIG